MLYCRLIQGTSPYLKFPSIEEGIKDIKISFVQRGKIVFTKGYYDCHILKDNTILVPLTQEDTYSLDENLGLIDVIVRISSIKGAVSAKIYKIEIKNIPDKEVIE